MQSFFQSYIGKEQEMEMGKVTVRDDIRSSIGPFHFLPSYITHYPEVVVKALGELYQEYNAAFGTLVQKNREWKTDYQYCVGMDGGPVNFAVQIDMVGLPQSFLNVAPSMSLDKVRETLRRLVFEFENSLAMYQLLERSFENGKPSLFQAGFRRSLDEIRARFNMPIALLAVTNGKYEAMLASEFGKELGQSITDNEVYELSGFDRFFGPEDFRSHVEESGSCGYLLYVRSSDPVAKLKKPALEVEQPLLSDPEMRRIIKAHALTFSVDAPDQKPDVRINDTKEYMSTLGMCFQINAWEELFDQAFAAHLGKGKSYAEFAGPRLSIELKAFVRAQGFDPDEVESGKLSLRAKPRKGAYGCYGHVAGPITDAKWRSELRRNISQRPGGYVVQVEMNTPCVINKTDGQAYLFIDRNFMAFTNCQPRFIAGFRSMMPVNSWETKKGRNHGNNSTVWSPIVA